MNADACYAHSLPDEPKDKWQKLEEHLYGTAELARQFAEPFGAGDWAYPPPSSRPARGAWIETIFRSLADPAPQVAPHAGRVD